MWPRHCLTLWSTSSPGRCMSYWKPPNTVCMCVHVMCCVVCAFDSGCVLGIGFRPCVGECLSILYVLQVTSGKFPGLSETGGACLNSSPSNHLRECHGLHAPVSVCTFPHNQDHPHTYLLLSLCFTDNLEWTWVCVVILMCVCIYASSFL